MKGNVNTPDHEQDLDVDRTGLCANNRQQLPDKAIMLNLVSSVSARIVSQNTKYPLSALSIRLAATSFLIIVELDVQDT